LRIAFALLSLAILAPGRQGEVHLITDEPEAVLRILSMEANGPFVPEASWNELFATDGYKRLKAREAGMKRKFEDADFRVFVESKELVARRAEFQKALETWKRADVGECQRRALDYLPKGADIRAKVYVLIKPKTNSFVWDTQKDPAIMLYLDPSSPLEAFAGTVAHEMHHIGYSNSCPSKEFQSWLDKQSQSKQTAYMWLGAFGEGAAVLAAAPGLDAAPQATAKKEVKDDWEKGMAHQPEQFKAVEEFFLSVCKGELTAEKAQAKATEFYGIVGPWYTVGYTMMTTIERAYGRERLIACYLDPRLLLATYNDAARKLKTGLPVWSDKLILAMK
jgi:hypothetical protein